MQLNKGNWVRDNQGVRQKFAHQGTTVDATYVLERLLLLLEVVRGRVEAGLRLRQLVLQLLHLLLQLLYLLLRLSGRFWRGRSRGVWSSFGAVLEWFQKWSDAFCCVFIAFRGNVGVRSCVSERFGRRMNEREEERGEGLAWSPGGVDSRSGGPSPSPRGAGWRS